MKEAEPHLSVDIAFLNASTTNDSTIVNQVTPPYSSNHVDSAQRWNPQATVTNGLFTKLYIVLLESNVWKSNKRYLILLRCKYKNYTKKKQQESNLS